MRLNIITFIILEILCTLNAQNLENEMLYPDTIRSTNDSVFINSPQWEKPIRLSFFNNDSINWGTYGYKGVYFEIWTDQDTVVLPDVNHPYQQLIKIPLASERDTSVIILRFQSSINSNFTNDYVTKNQGTVKVEIPEVYELANIILYLSNCSASTNNRPNTDYSKEVLEYFNPVRNHPIIRILNKMSSNNLWSTYYGFRENSLCFSFAEDFLEYNTPYKNVYWDDAKIPGGQFRNMLYLVQDFVNKSKFRSFYKEHLNFYKQLIARQEELLPMKNMWAWIETEFPQTMNSYKVVFSPLIGGSHSTQKFIKGFFRKPEFLECIMFINSTESIDAIDGYSNELKEGLMSGIVFTEIDHNYVNPTSEVSIILIKELITNKDFWATSEAQQNYSSEYSIFNEYMTHSIFCLYVLEKYESKIAEEIVNRRIQLMERRGYPKFEEFTNRLIRIMKDNPKTIYESYNEIIAEMKNIE